MGGKELTDRIQKKMEKSSKNKIQFKYFVRIKNILLIL